MITKNWLDIWFHVFIYYKWDKHQKLINFLIITYEGMLKNSQPEIICKMWPNNFFFFFCWKGVLVWPRMFQHLLICELQVDRFFVFKKKIFKTIALIFWNFLISWMTSSPLLSCIEGLCVHSGDGWWWADLYKASHLLTIACYHWRQL